MKTTSTTVGHSEQKQRNKQKIVSRIRLPLQRFLPFPEMNRSDRSDRSDRKVTFMRAWVGWVSEIKMWTDSRLLQWRFYMLVSDLTNSRIVNRDGIR